MRDKDAITNYNNMQKMLEENHNHIDYTALLEGAAKAEAERAAASREAWAYPLPNLPRRDSTTYCAIVHASHTHKGE